MRHFSIRTVPVSSESSFSQFLEHGKKVNCGKIGKNVVNRGKIVVKPQFHGKNRYLPPDGIF